MSDAADPPPPRIRDLGHELAKLAKAITLGQVWTTQQGLRASTLVGQIRAACFQARTEHLDHTIKNEGPRPT